MDFGITGKVAMVTGAGRGIGDETARMLAKEGARLVVADIDLEVANQVARELLQSGAQSIAVRCDVCTLEEVRGAVAVATEAFGGVGYSTKYPLERIFRDTAGGLIPEGTAEIQTLIVGREVLGMSAIV